MSQKSSLGPVGVTILMLLLAFVAALTVPMRHGASVWEAIALLPQAVLWVVPVIFATPILVALAARIRPHWHRLRDPEPTVVPAGSLAPLAEAIRAAPQSRLARSRVLARLARLAADLAVAEYGGTEESAWPKLLEVLRARHPEVARFLQREDGLGTSAEGFMERVTETLEVLERQAEEA